MSKDAPWNGFARKAHPALQKHSRSQSNPFYQADDMTPPAAAFLFYASLSESKDPLDLRILTGSTFTPFEVGRIGGGQFLLNFKL